MKLVTATFVFALVGNAVIFCAMAWWIEIMLEDVTGFHYDHALMMLAAWIAGAMAPRLFRIINREWDASQ